MNQELWIIEDWMGIHVFNYKQFTSFEDARAFISEYADKTTKTEDEYNGVCEDLYAVEVTE